jgi:hypothetical protein
MLSGILFIVVLNVIMLSIVALNVVMLSTGAVRIGAQFGKG